MSRTITRWRSVPTWVLALSSTMLLLVYMSLAAHVRCALGLWPAMSDAQYRTLAFQIHEYVFAGVLAVAFFAAIPVGVALALIGPFRLGLRLHLKQLAVFLVGWALIVALINFDPTTFTEWYLRK